MEVFELTKDDLPDTMYLGRFMHAESPNYKDLPYDPIQHGAWMLKRMNNPEDHLCIGVRNPAGQLIGGLFGVVYPLMFCDILEAQEEVIYVLPEYRGTVIAPKIIKHFMDWAEKKGAKRIIMGASTGISPERTAAFYKKFNFRPHSALMVKDVG
jgi:GNAT superfamily N-acetyltransferase